MKKKLILGVVLLVALITLILTSENREIRKLRVSLFSTDERLPLSNNEYKYYGKNIKYSANNDLMNDFRNRVDIEEKKIVVVRDMMYQKEPYFKENRDKRKEIDPFAINATRVLWNEANSYCYKLTLENYNDWRLPTSSELAQYYRSGIKVNLDKSMVFWTSTISEDKDYEYEGMSLSGQTYSLRGNGGYVICVREL